MKFHETPLSDSYVIELERHQDKRGSFARTFCQKEFSMMGIHTTIAQSNVSFNKFKGTIRGLHYQTPPFEEAKLVTCIKGSLFDVIIDLRQSSKTYKKWYGITLNEMKQNMLYIPEGFAHGFQTLEDNTTIFYQIFQFYSPQNSHGIRWNDPSLNIDWPIPNPILSEKDKNLPLL